MLNVLNETFGYNEDLHGMFRSQIVDNYKVVSKSNVELKKMRDPDEHLTEHDMDGAETFKNSPSTARNLGYKNGSIQQFNTEMLKTKDSF